MATKIKSESCICFKRKSNPTSFNISFPELDTLHQNKIKRSQENKDFLPQHSIFCDDFQHKLTNAMLYMWTISTNSNLLSICCFPASSPSTTNQQHPITCKQSYNLQLITTVHSLITPLITKINNIIKLY